MDEGNRISFSSSKRPTDLNKNRVDIFMSNYFIAEKLTNKTSLWKQFQNIIEIS